MPEPDALPPLPITSTDAERDAQYKAVLERLDLLLQGEDDWISVLATTVCELHHAFEYYHWTGFYRVSRKHDQTLVIGPYQGHLGCLRIPFARGVCGAAARLMQSQRVDDVNSYPDHIACASSTQSELVVPMACARTASLLAVLDIDSDHPAAFREVDQLHVEALCRKLGATYPTA